MRRASGLGAVVVVASLSLAACGSNLSTREIAAANVQGGTVVSGPTDDPVVVVPGGEPSETSNGASGSTAAPTGPAGNAGQRPAGVTSTRPSGPSGPLVAKGKPILLGNVGTYSGPVGNSVGAVREGILSWARHVNATGGINGRPVEVLVANDNNEPSKALSYVKDMVERKHVDAFIAMFVVMNTDAVRSYIERSGVPVIGGDLIDAAWVDSPGFFPQGASFPTIAASLAKLAGDGGTKRIGILYCTESPLCSIGTKYVEEAAPRYGAQVVYQSSITLTSPDYSAQCLGAQNRDVDFLVIGADPPAVNRISKSCAAQGYKPRYGVPSIAVTKELEHQPTLEGLVSGQAWFPWMARGTAALTSFHESLARYAPGTVLSGGAAGAWASGQLLVAAARRVTGPLTSTSLVAALNSLRGDNLGGLTLPLTFRRGARHPQPACYFPIKIVDGVFTAPRGLTPECL